MKRLAICFLILLSPYLSYCINSTVISGKIIDKESRSPIAFANVLYANKSTGTFSDEHGAFSLFINEIKPNHYIIISHIGYKTLQLTLEEASKQNTFELQISALEDVVITTKSNFKLKRFVNEVVKTYNKNRKKEPHVATAYVNEIAKKGQEYMMFFESLGYSIFSGNIANAAEYSNYKFFADNTRAYITNPEWQKFNDPLDRPARPGASSNLRALRVLEYQGILSQSKHKNYKYQQDSTYYDEGNNLIRIISFKGKGEEGSLHVASKSLQILSLDFTTDNYWSSIQNKEVRAALSMSFNYYENTPYLSEVSSRYRYQNIEHMVNLNILTQKFKDFKFSKEEYWAINAYDGNPYISFDTSTWDVQDLQQTLMNDVTKNLKNRGIDLRAEFKNYTDRWFLGTEGTSDYSRMIIKGLKDNF